MNRIAFLKTLYPQPPRGGLVLYTRSRRGQELAKWIETHAEADRFAASKRKSCDVYYQASGQQQSRVMALARERYAGRRATMVRGSASGAREVRALWAELDFAGTTHRGRHLPPDEAAALSLLDAVAQPPSIVVATGGGYHLYWLLREPLPIASDADRDHATRLLHRLQGAFAAAAAERGWRLPADGDLGRLLRLPGTLNHRAGRPLKVQVVRELLGDLSERRYRLEDFDRLPPPRPLLARAAPLLRPRRPAEGDFEPVFRGCGFLQHCWEHRDELPFEAWLVLASIVGPLALPGVDGSRLYHRMSRDYPGYRHRETEWRLEQVLAAGEPATCDDVARLGFGGLCAGCDHAGRLVSPVDLGRRDAAPEAVPAEGDPPSRRVGLGPPARDAEAEGRVRILGPREDESRRVGPGPPARDAEADDRVRIVLGPREDEVAEQALAALAGRARDLYQRGGARFQVTREGGEAVVRRVHLACLRQLLAKHCAFVQPGRGGAPRPVRPPRWLVQALAQRPSWPGLPVLASAVEGPARRRDPGGAEAADEAAVGALLRALADVLEASGGAASSSQILDALAEGGGRHAALRAALARLFPDLRRGRPPTSHQLTGLLGAWRGVAIGGRCLVRAGRGQSGVRWRVRPVGRDDPAARGAPVGEDAP